MQYKKSAFTLIELMIVMTIIVVMSIMIFAPYAYYINKSKVKFTNKELTQTIYEAKNKALHGSTTSSGNISMGIYFDTSVNNNFSLLTFVHDISDTNINIGSAQKIQEKLFQPGVQIDSFNGEDKGLIFFRSITGETIVFSGDPLSIDTDNEINIDYSYEGSSNIGLKDGLVFFQDTQIVDY